jgi:D-serine deaminase-like pyridoxal phosphate-dependent protein
VLTESAQQLEQWKGSRIGVFVDLNPGMNRTGIGETHVGEVVELVKAIQASGLEFRGLHYYDGQYATAEEPERTQRTHEGYRHLLTIVDACEKAGAKVQEVITSGTPVFRSAASFRGFVGKSFVHRVSPGTIVYSDATSLAQLADEPEYQPAVLVVTRVVSHPRAGMVTCDAGHKAVSADSGLPTCVVVGHPELTPLGPSEEHQPLAVQGGAESPRLGDTLFLLPRHICPSVNNFNEALIVRNGHVEAVEQVTARGRETPLLGALELGAARKV